ncbi:oligosaccharide repeat unit polymerase family protein [Thermococcus aggregans]|uniref:Oligosaccharide repeat unit polymerase family protein n=1 Tax=Thermococcus aggregans TaxID=110163 RepID=A0A9E7SNY4_THEAG|nr:oligosaccharide repeat unit polymerase family protein [Thermococcus aggregans]USS40913.1 oligosaccharide repeat unit polymerase family protein [Thermococcus aggregans]
MRSDKIFALFLASYISLALLGKFAFRDYLGGLSWGALLYALMFSLMLLLGYNVERKFNLPRQRTYIYLILGILVSSAAGILGVALALVVLLIGTLILRGRTWIRQEHSKYAYYAGIALVIALPLLAMLKGVIPILNPQTRYSKLKDLYLASAVFASLLLAYKPNPIIFLLGEAFAVVSTFRTNALIIFLTYLFRAEKKELKRLLIIGVPLIGLAFLARFYATKSVYPIWKLGFLQSLVYRAGFSYMVYEKLFSLGMPFGNFELLLNPNAREYVAALFGKVQNYTYTIFGQPAYDLGIFGLFEAFIVGMALSDSEKSPMFKALSLAFLVPAIETGFDALNFGILMGSAYFALLFGKNTNAVGRNGK